MAATKRVTAAIVLLGAVVGCDGPRRNAERPSPVGTGGDGGSRAMPQGGTTGSGAAGGMTGTGGTGGSSPGTSGGASGMSGGAGGNAGQNMSAADATLASDRADAAPDQTAMSLPEAGQPDMAVDLGNPITAGWTQRTFMFTTEGPWNVGPTGRYTHNANTGTHTFWIEISDEASQQGSGRDPNSEMRWTTVYRTGDHMFDADVYIVPGTHGTGIFQIRTTSGTPATAIILTTWQDGTVRQFFGTGMGPIVKRNAHGLWWNLKVIHNTQANEIKVYADNVMTGSFTGAGEGGWYFQNGVYATKVPRAETRWQNIRYWVR
jgi:hypothetical protein